MASLPATKTRKLTRDKLRKFLPNHESIRAFEELTQDVTETLPQASYDNSVAAEQAATAAASAADLAESALVAAGHAQASADVASQQAGEGLTAPDHGALWAEISKLRARVATLEQGTNP